MTLRRVLFGTLLRVRLGAALFCVCQKQLQLRKSAGIFVASDLLCMCNALSHCTEALRQSCCIDKRTDFSCSDASTRLSYLRKLVSIRRGFVSRFVKLVYFAKLRSKKLARSHIVFVRWMCDVFQSCAKLGIPKIVRGKTTGRCKAT